MTLRERADKWLSQQPIAAWNQAKDAEGLAEFARAELLRAAELVEVTADYPASQMIAIADMIRKQAE